jgi:hypothetical protein
MPGALLLLRAPHVCSVVETGQLSFVDSLLRMDAPVTFVQQSDEGEPVRELCWFHSCFSGTEKAEGTMDQSAESAAMPRQALKKNHASMGATSTDGYAIHKIGLLYGQDVVFVRHSVNFLVSYVLLFERIQLAKKLRTFIYVQTLKSEDRLHRSQRLLQRTDCVLTVMRTLQRFLCVQLNNDTKIAGIPQSKVIVRRQNIVIAMQAVRAVLSVIQKIVYNMPDLSMNENSDELKITELGFQLLVPMVKDNALACAEITARDITFLQEQVSSSVHVLAHGSTLLLQTVLTSSIAVHSRLTTQHLQHFFGQVDAAPGFTAQAGSIGTGLERLASA